MPNGVVVEVQVRQGSLVLGLGWALALKETRHLRCFVLVHMALSSGAHAAVVAGAVTAKSVGLLVVVLV